MPTKLAPGQDYAGRRPGITVINCTLSKEVGDILRSYCPGRTLGRFVERLIVEFHGRQQAACEERQRIAQQLLAPTRETRSKLEMSV